MSETDCKYISSKGILKSCCLIPNKQQSSLPAHKFIITKNINNSDIISIYVCSTALLYFTKLYMNQITYKYVIVAGDSDMTINAHYPHIKLLLNHPNLIHLYVQNGSGEHEKMTKLPIGLDYHTFISKPQKFWKLKPSINLPIRQENELVKIKNRSKPFDQRIKLCFVNFGNQYPDRIKAHKELPSLLIHKMNTGNSRNMVWNTQSKFTFVISPFGHGIDCHRTWEALILGCIPIVKHSSIIKVFDDLPVLIIKEWRDINKQLLEKTIEDYKKRDFNYEKLTLKYWTDLINSHK